MSRTTFTFAMKRRIATRSLARSSGTSSRRSSRSWLILAKKPKTPARTSEMTKRMPKAI
ncbi:hypothetical protein D6C95_08659, partial [Aureobasidium pullulans]